MAVCPTEACSIPTEFDVDTQMHRLDQPGSFKRWFVDFRVAAGCSITAVAVILFVAQLRVPDGL